MPTANDIQKERKRLLEEQAAELLEKCGVVTLASVNEKGYPRICTMRKCAAEGFRDIYFVSSKRSKLNGKVTHFENNDKASVCYSLGGDSVTLIGRVEFVTDRELQGYGTTATAAFPKGYRRPEILPDKIPHAGGDVLDRR